MAHESISTDTDAKKALKTMRTQNLNKIIIAQLNINSLRNKFEMLCEEINGNIDILLIF